MQKFRVLCPYCEASLLVTEDLLGQPGNCPACQEEFLIPAADAFLETHESRPDLREARPVPLAGESRIVTGPKAGPATPALPPLIDQSAVGRKTNQVKIESRSTLRLLAGLLRGIAALQIIAGCAILLILLIGAVRSPVPFEMALITIGIALMVGTSAIPMLAFSQLIVVFVSQEEMLRHILNELRAQE